MEEEEDYRFYGTPLQRAPGPGGLHGQDVRDPSGRRRFHGAFTGGFSAGHHNTVGSREGWTPRSFYSSRKGRAGAASSNVEEFMDEDEIIEHQKASIETAPAYDTFGTNASNKARRLAQKEATERPSAIPGLLPDELIVPVASSIGIRLLEQLGWRQGKAIGEFIDDRGGSKAGKPTSAQGGHPGDPSQSVPVPKNDRGGIGYDPFKNAEEFRHARRDRIKSLEARDISGHPSASRGVAFGVGSYGDADTDGLLDDYVQEGGIEEYARTTDDHGMPLRRGSTVRRQGLGDRLLESGYSFEVQDGGEDEPTPLLRLGTHNAETSQITDGKGHVPGSLLRGFSLAVHPLVLERFARPVVPDDFEPFHRTQGGTDTTGAPLTCASEPSDKALKGRIDMAAFQVAKNGQAVENMLRSQQSDEASWSFLCGGNGAAYYAWKVSSLQNILGKRHEIAAEARRSTLDATQRGSLLGEQPPPPSAPGDRPVPPSPNVGVHPAPSAASAPDAALARSVMQLAEHDRSHLSSLLTTSFVRGELHSNPAKNSLGGLRPGVQKVPTDPQSAGVTPSAPAAVGFRVSFPGKVVTVSDLSRSAPASQIRTDRLPVRSSEEWRPAPLLCKRFNVPDPYHGRPAPLQISRFKTDFVALSNPEATPRIAAGGNCAAPLGLGPSDAAQEPAIDTETKSVEERLPSHGPQKAASLEPRDAAAESDAFLTILAEETALNSLEPRITELGSVDTARSQADLFKAIFEDSYESDATPESSVGGPGARSNSNPQEHGHNGSKSSVPVSSPDERFGIAKLLPHRDVHKRERGASRDNSSHSRNDLLRRASRDNSSPSRDDLQRRIQAALETLHKSKREEGRKDRKNRSHSTKHKKSSRDSKPSENSRSSKSKHAKGRS